MRQDFPTFLRCWFKNIHCMSLGVFIALISFPNLTFASEPKPWQMDLQEPAGIIASIATDLHNFLLIVITLISCCSWFANIYSCF